MSNHNETTTTFQEVIEKNKIEIPIIQRDYVQGRTDNKTERIRDKFLDSIFEVLSGKKENLHLDFVYGSTQTLDKQENENKKFIPLDGQQRLTTLFLLYWYFGKKEQKTDGIELEKFTYETKASSREFCRNLVKMNRIDFEAKEISDQIKDCAEFLSFWEKDPTVCAMLVMIDAIHDKKIENGFKKLRNIKFDFLELTNFGLTDDLYIKMNARGKALTNFENFKAEFEKHIEENDLEPKLETIKNEEELKETFSYKIDGAWLDLFWKLNLQPNPNGTDAKMVRFFTNISVNFFNENNNEENIYKTNADLISFYEEVYTKENSHFEDLKKVLNKLCEIYEIEENPTDDTGIKEKDIKQIKELFINFIEENPTYHTRIKFYVLSLFLIKIDNPLENIEKWKKWKRITDNLINNTYIQGEDEFVNAIQSLKSLSENIQDIYEYVAKSYDHIRFFFGFQRLEESDKCELIAEDTVWESELIQAEEHWYLGGQVGFLLNFADEDLEKFKEYRDKFIALFGFAQDDDKDKEKRKQRFIYRALLTQMNCFVERDRGNEGLPYFNNDLRSKNYNWRKIFNDKNNRKTFKDFLDKINKENIEDDLNKLIEDFNDKTDWRYHFIKQDEIIDYIKDLNIRKDYSLNRSDDILLSKKQTNYRSSFKLLFENYWDILLLRKKQTNGYHTKYQLYALYLYLVEILKNNTNLLEPQKVEIPNENYDLFIKLNNGKKITCGRENYFCG